MPATASLVRGEPLPEHLPTIGDFFRQAVASYPDKVALSCPHQPANLFGVESIPLDAAEYQQKAWLRWSYKDFKKCVDRCASALRVQGVTPGTTVITFLPNLAEFLIIFWAADALGCSFVPISPRTLINIPEVEHMIRVALSAVVDAGKAVIVAGDDSVEKVDALTIPGAPLKYVVGRAVDASNWLPFETLMQSSEPQNVTHQVHSNALSMHSLVMFTSGTTALPKGCLLDQKILRSIYMTWKLRSDQDHRPETVLCHSLPNNHAASMHYMLHTLCEGGTLVHPGPGFDPDLFFRTLSVEDCTLTLLVPTAIHGVVVAATGLPRPKCLECVTVGGAGPSIRDLEIVFTETGTQNVRHAFGMSEGLIISTERASTPTDMVKKGLATCGQVSPGCSLKICAPGNQSPVPRGKPGELHASSPFIIRSYIGIENDSFYTDADGTVWFNSGDQAFIDDDGFVFITGRYKEMLIRGAENISPVAVEAAISTVPELASLQICIVGVPDEVAGQVPVAISTQALDITIQKRIRSVVVDRMGPMFAPEAFYCLAELGLSDYPRTTVGKIQKIPLSAMIAQHRDRVQRENDTSSGIKKAPISFSDIQDTIAKIWAHALGMEVGDIPLNRSIAEFADSIAAMRVRGLIRKQTDRDITLAELTTTTIEQQIQLLQSRSPLSISTSGPPTNQRLGPPSATDMVHVTASDTSVEVTKQVVEQTLAPFELSWNDVEDVMPAYDFNQVWAETGIVDSYSWNFAILPKTIQASDLQVIIERLLQVHPLLRSFFIRDIRIPAADRLALHVNVRPRPALLKHMIEHGGTIGTLEDFGAAVHKYPTLSHAEIPGPMAAFIIYHIKEIGAAGFTMRVNHSIFDGSYGHLFLEDIERACGGLSPHPHVDYKLWADCHYSFRRTPKASASVKYHINKLTGIGAHRGALWPPRSSWDPKRATTNGYTYQFECPSINMLRKHNPALTASAIFKAATSLLNIHQTGHGHALFLHLETARSSFPFLPSSMAQLPQLDALDVAGQCMNGAINIVSLCANETVQSFLARVQADQNEMTRHANVPWHGIMDGLGADGVLLPEVLRHQLFNWVPDMLTMNNENKYQNFRVVDSFNGPLLGLGVRAGYGGPSGSLAGVNLNGIGLSMEEKEAMALNYERVLGWLCEEGNWEKGVAGFGECL